MSKKDTAFLPLPGILICVTDLCM